MKNFKINFGIAKINLEIGLRVANNYYQLL